jgi:RNA polymerase sigma-70 factor (ECF subfamily)
MDERALIEKLLAGDERAFRVVVSDYHGVMLHVARAIVGSAVAEEVVQDAWIAVLRALPRFEGRSSLKTWILQIVSNQAKTRRRREIRNVAVGQAADVEDMALAQRFAGDGHWSDGPGQWRCDSPESILSSAQLKVVIEQTIDRLPDSQKAVLTLFDIEGVDMLEICKILDLSETNGRVLLHRARTRVWQAIDRFQRGDKH